MCVTLSLSPSSVPRLASSEKGVSACLLLKGREGSFHGGPSLLSPSACCCSLALIPSVAAFGSGLLSLGLSSSLLFFLFFFCWSVCVCLQSHALLDWLIFLSGVWFLKVTLVFFQFSFPSSFHFLSCFLPTVTCSPVLFSCSSASRFLLTFSHSPPPIDTPPPCF